MRIVKESHLTCESNYTIHTEEGIERGLFFRCPIQKIHYDHCSEKYSPHIFQSKLKNPVFRFFQSVIGNKKVVDNVDSWMNEFDFCGFKANIMCSPVYFNRKYQRLVAYTNGRSEVHSIVSFGYEGQYNICDGKCDCEKTTIYLKNKHTIKERRKGEYHYTYQHISEKILEKKE